MCLSPAFPFTRSLASLSESSSSFCWAQDWLRIDILQSYNRVLGGINIAAVTTNSGASAVVVVPQKLEHVAARSAEPANRALTINAKLSLPYGQSTLGGFFRRISSLNATILWPRHLPNPDSRSEKAHDKILHGLFTAAHK